MTNKLNTNKQEILKIFKRIRPEIYPTEWKAYTYNDSLNTKLFTSDESIELSRDDIVLNEGEEAILECALGNGNYFLLTTHRIISYYRNVLSIGKHEQLWGFDLNIWRYNYPEVIQKTDIYLLKYFTGGSFLFEIDSALPGVAVRDLLTIIIGRHPYI